MNLRSSWCINGFLLLFYDGIYRVLRASLDKSKDAVFFSLVRSINCAMMYPMQIRFHEI